MKNGVRKISIIDIIAIIYDNQKEEKTMDFIINPTSMMNIIFIAIGIGICGLCILHMTSASHIRKDVRVYFIFFFSFILLYITAHMARELMNYTDIRVDGIEAKGLDENYNLIVDSNTKKATNT